MILKNLGRLSNMRKFLSLVLVMLNMAVFAQQFNNEWIDFSKPYYKFKIGEKVNWSKGSLLKKPEIILCEVISLDELNHKALVKYLDKENKEVQTKADYLDLSKTN